MDQIWIGQSQESGVQAEVILENFSKNISMVPQDQGCPMLLQNSMIGCVLSCSFECASHGSVDSICLGPMFVCVCSLGWRSISRPSPAQPSSVRLITLYSNSTSLKIA